jgi:hypothetical protein
MSRAFAGSNEKLLAWPSQFLFIHLKLGILNISVVWKTNLMERTFKSLHRQKPCMNKRIVADPHQSVEEEREASAFVTKLFNTLKTPLRNQQTLLPRAPNPNPNRPQS